VVLDCGDNADQHPEQILIMDAPDKKDAKNVIRINKNGIGFSTSGYDGIYRNAWTIDGNLVADFITTGTMLANRIRGGELEIGGESDGVITVKDASGNTIVIINKDGLDVEKGSISGTTITVGGKNNADGSIAVKNASGTTTIKINNDGINVNDAFIVNMSGEMKAISIAGDAVDQINDIIEDSDAMVTANKAIKLAQSAADTANSAAATAQSTADTAKSAAATAQAAADKANSAADTANSAAATAQSTADTANSAAKTAQAAADKAQKAIDTAQTSIDFSYNAVVQHNTWFTQVSSQLQTLGQAGIS
jgi:uncharacterized membrane protein